MKTRLANLFTASLALVLATFFLSTPCRGKAANTPVINVTDLYHPCQDIGDNFDLLTAYALPEIDLSSVSGLISSSCATACRSFPCCKEVLSLLKRLGGQHPGLSRFALMECTGPRVAPSCPRCDAQRLDVQRVSPRTNRSKTTVKCLHSGPLGGQVRPLAGCSPGHGALLRSLNLCGGADGLITFLSTKRRPATTIDV